QSPPCACARAPRTAPSACFAISRPPPPSTPLPYTTLFRSITLPPPATPHGELELRTGGCDGTVAAVLALEAAAASHAVTRLSAGLAGHAGPTDLCVRFRVGGVDPLWVLDWIELGRAADTGPAR